MATAALPACLSVAPAEQARAAERAGRHAEARALYERAFAEAQGADDASGTTAALRALARTADAEGDTTAALRFADEALAAAEAAGDARAAGQAVNARATVLWRQGDVDEAERLFLRARAMALRAGDAALAAATSHNLGASASVRGAFDEACRHYESGLEQYRALDCPHEVGVALASLGKLHTARGAWDDAARTLAEAEHAARVAGAAETGTWVALYRAELCVARGDHAGARALLDGLLAAGAELAGGAEALGTAYRLRGIAARELDDDAGAELDLARAAAIAEQRGAQLLLGETLRERATLYRRLGRNREALQALDRAHRIFARMRARRDLADVDAHLDGLAREFEAVARRWGESIEAKDLYTQGHCVRVAELACRVAARAGIPEADLPWFRIGALLHDVGKLVIPGEVLNKEGRLTEAEWELMRGHPTAGVEMLAGIEFPWDVRPVVELHHERWDGGGYPHGLAGEAIPLPARVLAVADVYDALTTRRSYKPALGHEAALELMRRDAGFAFDPAVFAVFEQVVCGELLAERAGDRGDGRPGDAAPAGAAGRALEPTEPPDELTGLLLRRGFTAAAGRALRTRRLAGGSAALLVIDVDHFKLVNDSFGHLQGDDMLRAVAEVLAAGVRPGDLVGRYAGDEFVVLLRDAAIEEACLVAEQLRAAAEARRCPRRGALDPAETVGVTLSIGVAVAPQHGETLEELFGAADGALYGAKRRGRNAVTPAAGGGAERELVIERFAGRSAERARLDELLAAAAAGEPRVVAVVGEAGVGKSTLVRQLAAGVRVRGGALVGVACHEADVRPPFGPWAELIAAVHALGRVEQREWRELGRLHAALRGGAAPAGEGSRYALFEEVVEYLRLATAARPLVVVLDDMQWADAPTWDALEALVARLDRERLLVCLSVRTEDLHGAAAERRRRLSRAPRYEELALGRLARLEVEQWLGAVFGGRLAGDALVDDLVARGEGNPLFTQQMLRALVDEGAVRYAAGRWDYEAPPEHALPVAVEDLLTRRLDRLGGAARRTLTTAAVLGREFDAELLVAAEGDEDAVLDALDAGIAAAVLRPAAAGGARFAFAHALLADVLRRGANPLRLRRAHGRVARLLAERRPEVAGEIALHFECAGEAAEAYRYAVAAGEGAAAVYAQDEAAAYYERAVRLAPAPADAARAAWQLALLADARGHYAEVAERCDALTAGPGRTGAETAGLLAAARRLAESARALQGGDPQATLERCAELLADARAIDDSAECVALLNLTAKAHERLGDVDTAHAVAREALAEAERAAAHGGDARAVADALMRLGNTVILAHPEDAVLHFRRALDLYARRDDVVGQLRCLVNLGNAYLHAENHPAAESSYADAQALGRRVKAPNVLGGASLNLGVLLLRTGAFARAQECFAEAGRCFDAIDNAPLRLAALYNLANLAREQGDAAEAAARYEPVIALAGALGQLDVHAGAEAGLALAELGQGARRAAARRHRVIAALLAGREDRWFQGAELWVALGVRLAAAEGAVPEAEAVLRRALAHDAVGDGYVAAWLVAECAPALVEAGAHGLRPLIERHAAAARARGYAPLAGRLAAAGA